MNCIIIHGSPDTKDDKTYNKHWIPWIKQELEKRNIKTHTPIMPEPWKPEYKEWKKEFEKLIINENSILIGHSAGGGFLVRWLGETETKIKKLILIAPAIIHSGSWKPLNDLLKFEINKNIKNNVKEIIIFLSDDDMKGIKKSVSIFHEAIGGRIINLKGKGHFTLEDMGTEKFPELLDIILNDK